MHTALHNGLLAYPGGGNGQLQTVARNIANPVEDFRRHVVMRQNHRILFSLQLLDGQNIGRVPGPVDFGDHARYARIQL